MAGRGDHLLAINEFSAAIMKDPNHGLAYFYRALSLTKLKNVEPAIKDYDAVIRLRTSLKEALFNRGSLYYAQARYALALADLDASIALDATRWNVFFNRALAHYMLSDNNKALGDLNKTIELNPRYGDAFKMRAVVYCKQMLKDAARKDEDAAIALGVSIPTRCGV